MTRPAIYDGQQIRPKRAGDDDGANPALNILAADANTTLSVANMSIGGVVIFTGFTAGRNLTADTAVNYAAAYPDMDIGDSKHWVVSITTAFAGTLVAAAGVTLVGRATVPASSTHVDLYLTKTAAAAFNLTVA